MTKIHLIGIWFCIIFIFICDIILDSKQQKFNHEVTTIICDLCRNQTTTSKSLDTIFEIETCNKESNVQMLSIVKNITLNCSELKNKMNDHINRTDIHHPYVSQYKYHNYVNTNLFDLTNYISDCYITNSCIIYTNTIPTTILKLVNPKTGETNEFYIDIRTNNIILLQGEIK